MPRLQNAGSQPWLNALRWWLAVLLLATTSATLAAAPMKIVIVLSKKTKVYEEVAQAIQSDLPTGRRSEFELETLPVDRLRTTDILASPPALFVTVGTEAARQVAEINPAAPILHTLLPRQAALEILRDGRKGKAAGGRDSAIFLDQPIGRQLDLLRLALPRHKRVAVILGPATRHEEAELRAAAAERSLTIETATIERREELLHTLEGLLDDNDVLLSVPEPLAYHSETIHHVMLTTYRYKIPVLGLSRSYVDAGALIAVYSTPEQIGHQVAQWLWSLPAGRVVVLPAPAYPKYFVVSINQRVAGSLDLSLASESSLQQKLEALSRAKP